MKKWGFQNQERLSGWASSQPQGPTGNDWWIHGAGLGMTVICNHLLVLPHSGPLYPPESVGGTVVSPQEAAGLGARVGPGGTCRG